MAKNSMKKLAWCFSDCWYRVCSIAWPVRSAAAQVRWAVPLPKFVVMPPKGRW